jgi:hypothetical protein
MNPGLIFDAITTVVYPLGDLALLVLCLVLLRGRGRLFLAIAFALQFLAGLIWVVVNLLHAHGERVFAVTRAVTFVFFLGTVVFLILGFVRSSAATAGKK